MHIWCYRVLHLVSVAQSAEYHRFLVVLAIPVEKSFNMTKSGIFDIFLFKKIYFIFGVARDCRRSAY